LGCAIPNSEKLLRYIKSRFGCHFAPEPIEDFYRLLQATSYRWISEYHCMAGMEKEGSGKGDITVGRRTLIIS